MLRTGPAHLLKLGFVMLIQVFSQIFGIIRDRPLMVLGDCRGV